MNTFYIYNTDKKEYEHIVENLPIGTNIIFTSTANNLELGEAVSILKENFPTYTNEEIIEQLSFIIDYYNVLKSSFEINEEYYGISYEQIAVCYGEFINSFDNIPNDADIVIINSNGNYNKVTELPASISKVNCVIYNKKAIEAMIELIDKIQQPLEKYFCNSSTYNLNEKVKNNELTIYM